MLVEVCVAQSRKKIRRYDSLKAPEPKQLDFTFDFGEELRRDRELNPPTAPEKRKFISWRKCLRCDRKFRQKWPGLCARCKRHEDYLDGGEDDNSVGI